MLFKINFAFLSIQNSFPLCHLHTYLLLSFAHITTPFFPVPPPPPASFYPPPNTPSLLSCHMYVCMGERMDAFMHTWVGAATDCTCEKQCVTFF